jgi:hypothetical protein
MTQLSDDEKKFEVWKTLRALNDCWTKDDGTDLVNYFHKDMVAITPVDRDRREGQAECVAGWVGFAKTAKIHHWQEIDPRIQLYGDTAVVTYYYDMSFEVGGQMIIFAWARDMFVFVKEDGMWWGVAYQFSQYPE